MNNYNFKEKREGGIMREVGRWTEQENKINIKWDVNYIPL